MFPEKIRKHVPGRNIRKHVRKEHSELQGHIGEKHSETCSREEFENMFPEKHSENVPKKNILDILKKTFGTCSGKHPEHCSGKKFGNMFDNISKKIPGNM
jgi:hypothetical protein